ncbi:MAG: serine protease [Planctomycetota bacterium]|nr:MAG: serine protease [Planctomycetota bacterium]REJ90977.1 MAG: serine protease [Planctomycetota bacterium]REK25459.1 MAG: serine protease [Planctomycetota bacterium]REK40837.1 MAG: serine protease [Planctomycetota bacterium]
MKLPRLLVLVLLVAGFFAAATGPARADVDQAVVEAEARRVAVVERISACTLAIFGAGGAGGGSGVVITPDGYALTNFHVTQPVGNAMKCGMADGKLYDAVIVSVDPTGDVAMIKLFGRNDFPTAEMGDSSQVRPGDWAYAVGNPFLLATDYKPTVSYGMISGVSRYQYPAGTLLEYTDCIQTDAAINPGNSGGPLFDDDGKLIGINGRGSFEKRGRVNVGVGYAISINQIKNFMGYLRSGRIVDHASWGTRAASDDEGRVVISAIQDTSDAYRRGLRYDDEILRFGGREIRTVNGLKNVLGIFPKGWRVPVTYRQDGEVVRTVVRLSGTHAQGELAEMLSGRRTPLPGPDEDPPDENGEKPADGEGDAEAEGDADGEAPEGGEAEEGQPAQGDEDSENPEDARPGAESQELEMPQIVRDHFEARTGFANYYFNQQQQVRVWQALQRNGSFGDLPERWVLTGKASGDDTGEAYFALSPSRGELRLPVFRFEAEFGDELNDLVDPPGSGGLLLALHLWQRFLREGIETFGDVYYLGTVPSRPVDDEAELRRNLFDVLVGVHGGVETRFHFDPTDGKLRTMEVFTDDDVDPCELYFTEYRRDEQRYLPTQIEVRFGDRIYARLELESIQFGPKED